MVDQDTEIGSGSTDICSGVFHRGALTGDNAWSWFSQALLDQPVLTTAHYRPGTELMPPRKSCSSNWMVGNVMIAPGSGRWFGADPGQRIGLGEIRWHRATSACCISPGVELALGQVSTYVDIEVPVFQRFNGNQLTAPWLLKFIAAYHF